MVVSGTQFDARQFCNIFQNIVTCDRMSLNLLILFIRQSSLFIDHLIRHADFSHVMQQSNVKYFLLPFFRLPKPFCYFL